MDEKFWEWMELCREDECLDDQELDRIIDDPYLSLIFFEGFMDEEKDFICEYTKSQLRKFRIYIS